MKEVAAPLRAARRATCCCLVLCTFGCTGPQPSKVVLEADSWWTSQSEQVAFDDILTEYELAHPDSTAVNAVSNPDGAAARQNLTARLLAGAAPSTFQGNIGADVLHWSVVDTEDEALPSSSRIRSLRAFFERNGLFDVLPSPLIDALMAGPNAGPYAIPVDIHRLNFLYYNAAGLADFSRRHSGASFLDREQLCPADVADRLKDPSAKLDVKIAVGTKDTFALTLLAFEAVLPAVAGPAVYDDVFRGRAAGDWQAAVRAALRCVQYLSRSFDRGGNWVDALRRVKDRAADFSVMGDWSNGELKGPLNDGTVIGVPFPGSERSYVFTSDTFPLPVGAPHPTQTQDLLLTIASPRAQLEFSQDKGSIPARSDVNVRPLGPRAIAAREAFYAADVVKLLATSGLFPQYYPGDLLNSALTAMTNPGASERQIDDVLAFMRDTEPLLARWQSRLADMPASDP